ncbi:transketolase [Terricaulis silvestris]|uniref:Transketolase n=1 Tax=Terricaulis silvestris TaxID=2686094 RepID=A0A6I6MQX6_9CAUL|nr:transketolase [Terricaulis silvestris]QGZ96571.1 Transketolase 1 [Terricaulis silvestris]
MSKSELIEGVDAQKLANTIRALAMDAVEQAKSGHPGMPMGMADAATVLFSKFLKYDPSEPNWPDRDRFVLSAGHGSMLLYALLYLTGYADMTLDEIKRFRQLGSKTAGHPENFLASGIETTTGPLGQGLANAVGMAMAEAHLNARFGDDLVDHRTWVIAGDGCLMEGISQEAIALAGRQKLNKLIVIWDDNSISIDGAVSLSDNTDQKARFAASQWNVLSCNGHDMADVARAFEAATKSDKPVLIACKTTIGFGAPKKAGTAKAHGEPLGAEELAAAKAALGWAHGPFEIPDDIVKAWRAVGARSAGARELWQTKMKRDPLRDAFVAAMSGGNVEAAIAALGMQAAKMAAEKPSLATRASSGAAIDSMFDACPELLGGSADLTGSNNTHAKGSADFTPENREGRYVRYGIREHGMAAAMNGMALHGGVIPYSGTFLSFADYSRPAIRLGALMGIRVIHVMTHDSIGLGEDGPTHQPVEQLAALRAIPNLHVFRPADAVEAAECWQAALLNEDGPSILALSRQATPALRDDASENLSVRGAYELLPAEGGVSKVAIFATGTEVALAAKAREMLQAEGIPTRVISAPCFEMFELQDEAYQNAVCGDDEELKIGCEAAIGQGWFEAFGLDAFVGMSSFGTSAPAKDAYKHFGITAEALVETAKELL